MLENHADGAAATGQLLLGHGAQVLPVNDHLSLTGPLQQVQAAHQGGLARPAHTHDAEDISISNGQGHIVQGSELSFGGGEAFCDMF